MYYIQNMLLTGQLVLILGIHVCIKADDGRNNTTVVTTNNVPLTVPILAFYAPFNPSPSAYLAEGRLETLATLQFAERNLRRRGVLPDNVQIEYHLAPTMSTCEYYTAVGQATKIYFEEVNFTAIIGPICTFNIQPLALWSVYYNIPSFQYVATDAAFSNKAVYQTMTRVSPNLYRTQMAIGYLLQWYKWNTVAIVYLHGGSVCDLLFNSLAQTLKQSFGINIALIIAYDETATLDDAVFDDTLEQVKKHARIVLMCFDFGPALARPFILAAQRHNMTTGDYAFIVTWFLKVTILQPPIWLNSSGDDGLNDKAKAAYRSVLMIEPHGTDQDSTITFNQIIKSEAIKAPYNVSPEAYISSSSRVGMYDAMYLFGSALSLCIKQDPSLYANGQAVFNCSKGRIFPGAASPTVMDNIAERLWSYSVKALDPDDNFTEMLFIQTAGCSNSTPINWSMINNDDLSEFAPMPKPKQYSINASASCQAVYTVRDQWFVGGAFPRDVPVCGFDGSKCIVKTIDKQTAAIIGVLASFLLLLTVGFLGYVWRNRYLQLKNLERYEWRIPLKELRFITRDRHLLGSMMSVPTGSVYGSVKSIDPTAATKLAFYREQVTVAKFIKRRFAFEFNHEQLLLIRHLKEIQHENLNVFCGIVVDHSSDLITVWVDCSRRSLQMKNFTKAKSMYSAAIGSLLSKSKITIISQQAMLMNSEVDLDFVFKSSILRDIAMGLDFLHKSSIGKHGLLSTASCAITSRWVVRLTDYGTDELFLKLYEQKILVLEASALQNILSTRAPELRHQGSYAMGTKAGDIYSFGSIGFEVLFRETAATDKTTAVVTINKAIRDQNEAMTQENSEQQFGLKVLELLKNCWNSNPVDRPTIQMVKQIILKETHSSKNLVDHMFSMMEKYAANLETIVEERTQQLQEERARAERLLYEMLPRCIADDLKNGRPVVPEEFDSATVYFSDIVGFTVICSDSSPIEVIDMLNSLYQQFDEIIAKYDCYKVETIGDAYLVVSGVPRRNTVHAERIADMALDIRTLVGHNYIVPHMPPGRNRVSIRIGIHSGPVAAGVIGLSMPRFCLFGDTVNVASRMESHGLPMKIQSSPATYLLLKDNKKFLLTPRGEIEVKGKGNISTYWVEHNK